MPPPSRPQRLAFAAAVAVAVALYTVFAHHRAPPTFVPDIYQMLAGARELLEGGNPYDAVGPGRRFSYPFPLLYPLPAVLVVTPIAWLPDLAVRLLFACSGAFLLAFALTRGGWTRTPALLSWPFLSNIQLAQWTPFLMAAALLPALGWVVACKPNVGLVSMASTRKPLTMFTLACVFALFSLLAYPTWPFKWLEAIREGGEHIIPLAMRPGGVIVLLAVLRWQRPEARTMLALALIPITSARNESLFLWLAPLTLRQSLILALSSHASIWADRWTPEMQWLNTVAFNRPAFFAVLFIYLPALWFLLASQPDVLHERTPATRRNELPDNNHGRLGHEGL